MKKSQFTLDDVTEPGFKILSVLTERKMVSQIAILTGLSNTTIRRILQRLEVFCLVEDMIIDQAKHFSLTKEGRSLVKRLTKKKTELNKVEKHLPQESVSSEEHNNEEKQKNTLNEPFNLSDWLKKKAQGLRTLSDEFSAMADDLSVYEE